MRLNANELHTIRTTLGSVDPQGRIYLYGSRADDARRGGDIDLYLETSKAIDLRTTLKLQLQLSDACRTKVDLLVKSPDDADMPIHEIAKRGIPL